MKSQSVTLQMKASEQYFPAVLLIMLCKVNLTFIKMVLKFLFLNDNYLLYTLTVTLEMHSGVSSKGRGGECCTHRQVGPSLVSPQIVIL